MDIHSGNMAANIDRLRIATPCPISWEQMTGNSQVRFCDHCQLNVYNISELSRSEAESLIASTEGRLCARLYRRVDGTVLTKDCPVGLRALRMRASKRAAAACAIIASIASAAFGQRLSRDGKSACTPQTKISRSKATLDSAAKVLSGTVVDPNGAVISGAKVAVKTVDAKDANTTLTDSEGRFDFASLAAGTYSVKLEATGFKTLILKNLIVNRNQLVGMDLILEPSIATETVGILAMDDLLDTPPGTTIITEQMIRKLPLQK